jgi:DGQHR domain-containing protein
MKKEYFGFKLRQRIDEEAISLFVFCAHAHDLINWVGIKRNYEHEQGIQRYLLKTRVEAITKFLKVSSINTIPNNILIAFDKNIASFTSYKQNINSLFQQSNLDSFFDDALIDWGVLSFEHQENQSEHEKPAMIVDGQHRLYGISAYEQENLSLIAVALLDAPPVEQAFQFIVINKKAKSVETDDAKSILADFVGDQEAQLTQRLQEVRIAYKETSLVQYINDEKSSPFYQMIDLPRTQRQLIPDSEERTEDNECKVKVTAIESCLQYIRDQFERIFANDDDSLIFFFFCIWDVVVNYYDDLWGQNNQFMSSLNITVINKFMIDKLSAAWSMDLISDVLNFDEVTKLLFKIFERIPQEFWFYDWGNFDNNNYYKRIIDNDLKEIEMNVRTGHKWDHNLRIVDSFQEKLIGISNL